MNDSKTYNKPVAYNLGVTSSVSIVKYIFFLYNQPVSYNLKFTILACEVFPTRPIQLMVNNKIFVNPVIS